METYLKADIFFFVTTIAVVIITIIASVVMVYLVNILRYLKQISRIAKDQAETISEDIDDLRDEIKTKGAGLASMFDFLGNMTRKRVNKTRSTKSEK